jgi:hypothetical protein
VGPCAHDLATGACVEIQDESELADYEAFLRRNPAAKPFVNLVGMTYDNFPKLADRKFNFFLTARRDDIKRILAPLNYECPSPEVVKIAMETPQVLKRPRNGTMVPFESRKSKVESRKSKVESRKSKVV